MGYESAQAVELVATTCCVCGRPLLDAPSVKAGIGPICADKTGYVRKSMPEAERAEVNRLVYEIAALGRNARAVDRLPRLRALGFHDIVRRVEERLESLVEIRTGRVEGVVPARVWVEFPKLEPHAFDSVLLDLRCMPGRQWVRDASGKTGRNTFVRTRESSNAWRALLAKHFPGRVVSGLKGLYVVWPDDGEC